jgi:hypothetical protein
MSGDLEAGGALATAALVASQVEGGGKPPHAGAPHGEAPAAPCGNCQAPLAGAYCHACGQRAHVHRSLLHLAEEVLHGVLHFDSKVWRTLPLLVAKPGELTRRYIDGQRTRYVSPLALFLFMTFLMFFALSFTGPWLETPHSLAGPARDEARAELQDALREARNELAGQQRELDQARKDREGVAAAERQLAAAVKEVQIAEAALAVFEAAASQPAHGGSGAAAGAAPGAASAATAAASTAAASAAASAPDGGINVVVNWPDASRAKVNTGSARLDAAIRKVIQNPELALYKFRNTAYKFSFMLVPLSLPFLWLMFIGRPGITMYDHAVFSLYSLSFMSLLVVVAELLELVPPAHGLATLLLVLAPPVHLFLHLRGTYRLGSTGAALGYTAAMGFVASLAIGLFVLFIAWVGLG